MVHNDRGKENEKLFKVNMGKITTVKKGFNSMEKVEKLVRKKFNRMFK